jgi:hypothetical protein
MNERIRELAEQAGEEAVKSVPFFRTGRCQIPSWVNVFIEVRDKKFAELIVRECIKAAGDPGDGLIKGDTWYDGVRASIWSIQQEFGLDRNFGIE